MYVKMKGEKVVREKYRAEWHHSVILPHKDL